MACLLAALGIVQIYRTIGAAYYEDFRIPQGQWISSLPLQEVSHELFLIVLGIPTLLLVASALHDSSFVRPRFELRSGTVTVAFVGIVVCALALASFGVARFGLGHSVVADDEHTYRFIAETLRSGSLTARSPGGDLAFFFEQFVVVTKDARYGKYPIGHPLLLAAGQALGLEKLVVPVLTALTGIPLFCFGRRALGPGVAALALLMFASSPQVIFTGATYLSQPASTLCLMGALYCLLMATSGDGRFGLGWLFAAGCALGYGVLVRPLPGVLFLPVALGWLAWIGSRTGLAHRRVFVDALALLAPALCLTSVILLVNRAQTGALLTSGYQTFHQTGEGAIGLAGVLGGTYAMHAMSIVGNLIRLDAWFLGWPAALLLCGFARGHRALPLLWGMLGASWLYRLIAPKTCVGGVGALYLTESIPVMCLLAAAGVRSLTLGIGRIRVSASTLLSLLAAGGFVSLVMFVPYRFADLARMGSAQLAAPSLIQQRGLHHAVVFHNGVVPPWTTLSWAYYPRCNSPALDDDILYLWFQPLALETNLELWRRRFPDRTAWYFDWAPGTRPRLVDLETFVRGRQTPAAP